MSLLDILIPNIKNEESTQEFLDINAIEHQTVHNVLLEQGFAVAQYPLFATDINKDWLLVHAAEHRVWSNVLGLPNPPDLDSVDFENEVGAADWFNSHELHHLLVSFALGL